MPILRMIIKAVFPIGFSRNREKIVAEHLGETNVTENDHGAFRQLQMTFAVELRAFHPKGSGGTEILCAQSFRDDAVLDIKNICQREKMLYLTVDGRINIEIYRGDTVRVTRSDMTTRLIRLQGGSFYNRLQKKMNG